MEKRDSLEFSPSIGYKGVVESDNKDLHLFEKISDTVPAMVAVYNVKTGQYLYVNRAIKKLLGYKPSDFMDNGMSFVASLVHPTDLIRITKENAKAIIKAQTKKKISDNDPIAHFEYRMMHKNGNYRWLHTDGSVFSRDKEGQIEYVLNASLDITERKRIEEELKELTRNLEKRIVKRTKELENSQERYKAFISQSTEGIWRFELDKPISTKLPANKQIVQFFKHAYLAECNDTLAVMYGLTRASDIIGARLTEFLVPDDPKNIDYLKGFISSEYNLRDAESHEKDREGNDRYFQNNLIGVVENGLLKRAWGTQIDITKQKELEKRKDEFISIASHELKTPLTTLKIYSDLLTTTNNKEKLSEFIPKITFQIGKLSRLVNDLLDATTIQQGKLTLHKERFNLQRLNVYL